MLTFYPTAEHNTATLKSDEWNTVELKKNKPIDKKYIHSEAEL